MASSMQGHGRKRRKFAGQASTPYAVEMQVRNFGSSQADTSATPASRSTSSVMIVCFSSCGIVGACVSMEPHVLAWWIAGFFALLASTITFVHIARLIVNPNWNNEPELRTYAIR